MDNIGLTIQQVQSQPYIGETREHQAVFVDLLATCAKHENRGRIEECRTWTDRTWLVYAGVSATEINDESTLWHWDDDDLVLDLYTHEMQDYVERKRDAARKGGLSTQAKRRAEAPADHARSDGDGECVGRERQSQEEDLDRGQGGSGPPGEAGG